MKETTERTKSTDIVAWMAEDGRVISAAAKAAGARDGGATKSSMKIYSIPLVIGEPEAKPFLHRYPH